MSLSYMIWALFEVVSLALALSISVIFVIKPFGHSLSISGVRPFSLFGLHYKYKTDLSISVSSIHFVSHIPSLSNPRWGTLTAFEYEQKDTKCHTSVAKVEVTFWFFPLLFRFSAGPWLAVELHDFRLRVWNSKDTPHWVQNLRRNLLDAILTGEILRCEDFKTNVALSSLTAIGVEDAQDPSSPVQMPGFISPHYEDDIRISAEVKGYDVINRQYRIYSFGKLRMQLRKSWIDSRGSYVLIAEENRWIKVLSPMERESFNSSFWKQLTLSIINFPSDVAKLYFTPSLVLDLYIPRADITFDDFRIQDAELLRQGLEMMQAELLRRGQTFTGIISDAIAHALLAPR